MALLVNFWYAHPVGHAVEALRYCLGYHAADEELEISLLLNGATATELGSCCPFIRETYAVDYVDFLGRMGDSDAALRPVPRDWDYVLDDQRSRQPDQLELAPGVRTYYQAAHRHFRARVRHGTAGSEPPAYVPNQRLELELPGELCERARAELGEAPVRIALMPAGSSEPARYPSIASWELIARALAREFPEAVFCLVGKLERDGRTATSATPADFDRIAAAAARAVSALDLPLLEQLAYVERCSLFLSPHTVRHGRARGRHALARAVRRAVARVALQRGAVLFGHSGHAALSRVHAVRSAAGSGRGRRSAHAEHVAGADRGRPAGARRGGAPARGRALDIRGGPACLLPAAARRVRRRRVADLLL